MAQRPGWMALRPAWLALGPSSRGMDERINDWMDERTDERMDGQKISPFYRTLFPIGAVAQKGGLHLSTWVVMAI